MPTPYTLKVLTDPSDFDQIRGAAGVNTTDYSTTVLQGAAYGIRAELEITYKLTAKNLNIDTIINGTSALDYDNLKSACIHYCAALICNSKITAVNTSVSSGDQTVQRGNTGTDWIKQKQEHLSEVDRCLKGLSDWLDWKNL